MPAFFKCPISLDLMQDPVSLCTGVSYDRSSIETWLALGHDTCPATMRPLDNRHLTPNHTLRRLIHQWCLANPSYATHRIPTPKPPLHPHHVHLLSSRLHDPSERLQSLRQLRTLSKESDSNKRCIKSILSAQILVDFIRSEARSSSPDMEIVQEGLGLLNLLPMDATVKQMMTDSPQLKLIARVLQRGSSVEARVNAAQLVEALAEEKWGKASVGEEDGIIEGLIELLKQENEQANAAGVKASLKALWSVTQAAKNRVKVVEFKGESVISALVEKLPGAERGTVERVMAVLDTLSSCAEGRAAISWHALAIPSVVRSLLVVSEMATEHAVGVLWSVCINCSEEELLQETLQMGLLKKLLLIVQMAGFNPRTLQKAKDLLRLFSNLSDKHCSSEEI